MKLLLIHSDFIEYEVKDKAIKNPEETKKKSGRMEEALTAFTAVEKIDEKSPNKAVTQAVAEIKKTAEHLKVKNIMIYPYAHLSSDLASPKKAQEILIEIEYGQNSLSRLIEDVNNRIDDVEAQLLIETGKEEPHLIYFGNLNDFEVEFPRTGPVTASSYFYETPFFEVNGDYLKIDYNIDIHNKDVGFSWTGLYLRICDEEFNVVEELLFEDGNFTMDTYVSMRYAYAFSFQLQIPNMSMPWGAPLYNFSLGDPAPSPLNLTHYRIAVPLAFENHAFLNVSGSVHLEIRNSTRDLMGSGTTVVDVLPGLSYDGLIEIVVPVENQLTETGYVSLSFEHPVFSFGPVENTYG